MEGSESGSLQIITDPDPGGSKIDRLRIQNTGYHRELWIQVRYMSSVYSVSVHGFCGWFKKTCS